MALLSLDGPAIQGALDVDTVTPVRAKVGASEHDERKVITVQPITGSIYVYFADAGEGTPSAVNVATKGFIHYKKVKDSYEAGDKQIVWFLAVAGTVNIRFAERG